MEKVLRKGLLCLGLIILTSLSFGQGSSIVGTVLYHDTNPMENVAAELIDSTGTVIATTTTNSAGIYEFTNVPDGDYTITFSSQEPGGGVTLTDAFLVMLYLLDMYTFTPFQEEVADVNGSGTINWDDYFEILVGYLNQGNPFSGGDWYFENVYVTVAGGNRDGLSTSGGSVGDVNGTFQPPKYGNCFINEQLAHIFVKETTEVASLSLEVTEPIYITGMHMVFNIPDGLTVGAINSSLPGIQYYYEGNIVRVTWMNVEPYPYEINPETPVLEVEVASNSNTSAGEEMHVALSSQSHFIGSDGNMLPFINLTLPGVKFEEDVEIALQETIYPNPFVSYATLEYDLPAEGNVKIIVSNNAGQTVNIVIDEFQQAGPHRITLDGSDWPSGLYHFAIQYSSEHSILRTGSMIKSK